MIDLTTVATRYAYNALGLMTHQWGSAAQPIRYLYDVEKMTGIFPDPSETSHTVTYVPDELNQYEAVNHVRFAEISGKRHVQRRMKVVAS